MSTRITQSMIARGTLHDLHHVAARLSETQQRLSTGKQLTRPSDDAFATGRAISLRADLEGLRQYASTASDATGWVAATDTALGSIGDVAQRARELLLQGSSDTASPQARAAIAAEVDQLVDAAKQEGNATHAGRYVFSGTRTDVRPYATGSPVDAYAGDANDIARTIGAGVSVTINVKGSDVLGDGSDGRLLDTLRLMAAHLRGSTPADSVALRTTDLAALDANIDTLLELRAGVGATTNRLDGAGARLAELQESASALLSETEDADMAEVLIDYSTQQSVYQSALKAGANVVQASLLDFLR